MTTQRACSAVILLALLGGCAAGTDRGDYPALLPIDQILAQAGVAPRAPAAPPPVPITP